MTTHNERPRFLDALPYRLLWCPLLPLALALSGCVAANKRPATESVKAIQQVRIVTLEAHPVIIEDSTALAGATIANAGLIPQSSFSAQRNVLAAGSLLMLVEHTSAERMQRTEDQSARVNDLIQRQGLWEPNHQAARMLAARLAERKVTASIADEPRALPPLPPLQGSQFRPRTWQRVMDWYADESPTDRYRPLAATASTAVMETGIGVCTIGVGLFVCQVHLKLIDPATGTMLGRSRGYDYYSLKRDDDLWADNGTRFRALFTQIMEKSVVEALEGLGF